MPRFPRFPKCLVHLAVALALLCAQTAGAGFCGGDLHDADSSRTHFHVGALIPQPAACGHCHHDDDAVAVTTWEFPAHDHDSDAVYVSLEAGATGKRVSPPTVPTASSSLEAVSPFVPTPVFSHGDEPPGPSPPSCPTYLRHCALLF
jgi:hypothetical protein